MITEGEIRYYKQLDELQQRLFLGMKAKLLQYQYPHAHTIMILCDGGGSNASAHYKVMLNLWL